MHSNIMKMASFKDDKLVPDDDDDDDNESRINFILCFISLNAGH